MGFTETTRQRKRYLTPLAWDFKMQDSNNSGLLKNELYFKNVGSASKRPYFRMEFSYGIFQLFYLLNFTCFSATFVRGFFSDVSDVLKFAHANLFLKKSSQHFKFILQNLHGVIFLLVNTWNLLEIFHCLNSMVGLSEEFRKFCHML